MSDWVRVIVCWCGLDHLGKPHSRFPKEDTEARAAEIEAGYLKLALWNVHRKALCHIGDEAGGLACEATLVLDTSLWNRKAMLEVLAGLAWKRPEQVFIFWKAEADTHYSMTSLGLATEPLAISRLVVEHDGRDPVE